MARRLAGKLLIQVCVTRRLKSLLWSSSVAMVISWKHMRHIPPSIMVRKSVIEWLSHKPFSRTSSPNMHKGVNMVSVHHRKPWFGDHSSLLKNERGKPTRGFATMGFCYKRRIFRQFRPFLYLKIMHRMIIDFPVLSLVCYKFTSKLLHFC